MKKIYLLAITAIAFSVSANAQFTDDMESYNLGEMGTQADGIWDTWSGNPNTGEDLTVVDNLAQSGFQSGYVGAGEGPQDVMLLFGNKTTGTWVLDFSMFIPTGKTGYFNLQGETDPSGGANAGAGIFNSPNLVFNNTQSTSGAAGQGGAYPNVDDAVATYTWAYPENTWFDINIVFNLADLQWTMTIDGVALPAQPFDGDITAGGMDFFAIDANNEYYLDDLTFSAQGGVSDFDADSFSVYPNPVKDVLNISSKVSVDAVTIYDVLGKVVAQSQPATISPKVDMSGLSSGAYLVQVTIGDASKTIKVIK